MDLELSRGRSSFVRLYVFDYGSIDLTIDALVPGEGQGKWMTVGVPGYLIQTDDGKTILIDSGMPQAYVDDPINAAIEDGYDSWFKSSPREEHLPAGRLAKIGLTPDDVTHLVVTHTHIDHAGGLGAFPNAIHVIQKAERDLETPVYRRFSWPEGVEWQVVEGDAQLAQGVRLLFTPGHTPGHMSALVDLPKTGKILIAIDAIYLPLSLEKDNFKASWNADLARESGHRTAWIAGEEGAMLMFGHDPQQ
jgi:N-acyl homoserine lactone hydrolase